MLIAIGKFIGQAFLFYVFKEIINFNFQNRFDRKTFEWAIPAVDLADEWSLCPLITDPSSIVVHYTPHYLYAPSVPFELRTTYPNPNNHRFIVMLRDPVARAVSSYWFKNSRLFHTNDQGELLRNPSGFHSLTLGLAYPYPPILTFIHLYGGNDFMSSFRIYWGLS